MLMSFSRLRLPALVARSGRNYFCTKPGSVEEVIDKIDLSEDEIKRLAMMRSDAPLPEMLGEAADWSTVMPELFFEEQTVNFASSFIEACETIDLSPDELLVVENFLDCVFSEQPSPRDQYSSAIACLRIPKINQNNDCLTFLAKVINDLFHPTERRFFLTLIQSMIPDIDTKGLWWILDDVPSIVLSDEVMLEIAFWEGSPEGLFKLLEPLGLEAGSDLALRAATIVQKRNLKTLLEEAFAAFVDASGHVRTSDVRKAIESCTLDDETLRLMQNKLDNINEEALNKSKFIDLLVFE